MKDYPRFTELRVRTKTNAKDMEAVRGKLPTMDFLDTMLVGPTEVRLPDGRLLAKYLPGALDTFMLDEIHDILYIVSKGSSDNRGDASGYERVYTKGKSTRTRTPHVNSSIIGAFDRSPAHQMRCRLTAWSGKELYKWQALFPLFQSINEYFKVHVPERYAVQEGFAAKTHPDWRIADTVFTTVTVNRSYPTGVHTDAGDLDEGFSTLAVLRKGNYSGGLFVFPEYRIGVNMQHGDLLLMDAHQWHGNTYMECGVCKEPMGSLDLHPDHTKCGAERISVVSYYRTRMAECGSADEEYARGREFLETQTERAAAHKEALLASMQAEAYKG